MPDIIEVASDLGCLYFIRKDAAEQIDGTKATKKQEATPGLRQSFFDLATETIVTDELASKTVVSPNWTDEDKARVLMYNSGWNIWSADVIVTPEGDVWNVVLIEDPDFKSVEIVVEGYTLTKQIRSGQTMIDDENMKIEEPDLYKSITQWPIWTDYIRENVNDRKFNEWAALYGWTREFTDPATWDDETREAVKQYTYEGPKTKALIVKKTDAQV